MKVRELTREKYEELLDGAPVGVAIEQFPVWLDFQATIEGRTPWGLICLEDEDGTVAALCALVRYDTHGYHYLRSAHGPAWLREPSEQDERAALDALLSYVGERRDGAVFLRVAVDRELDVTRPCLSTLPYDTTVIIDVTGGDEAILSRMKPRGRRDVRKSLRECPAELADETSRAAESFAEYYQVMCETGERDGFTPAPLSDFQSMVRTLGEKHCRVLAARVEGRLVAWSLLTLAGGRATRYYAATARGTGRLRVADALVFFECARAAELGCVEYDLMGIGSEFAPETLNLNEFKTKFAKDGVRRVAPDRDVPVKRVLYAALVKARDLRSRMRSRC